MLLPVFMTTMAVGLAITAFSAMGIDENVLDDDYRSEVFGPMAFGMVVYGCGLSCVLAYVL